MKLIGKGITFVASFAFMLALCLLEANPVLAGMTILFSGAWIVTYCYWWEEDQRRLRKEGGAR